MGRRLAVAIANAVRPDGLAIVPPVLAILVVENDNLYRLLYYVHLLSAIAAFGPLFLYPRLQRAGETTSIARLHMRLVFPAMVLLWIVGMGMAGVAKMDLAGTPFVTATIILWLIALVTSWFLIRPALTESDEGARSRLAIGVGVTHVILIAALYLMIFKPGGYAFK